MKELKIEQWPVERLRPYGRELKVTDKALPQMVDALRQWGFRIPLLVTGDGEIVDGKTRYRAALELRMETVPVIVADDLTPTQVRTFRLLVNRSATWADWNDEALRAEMAELRLELDDLRLTGFADKELDIFLQGAVADSEKDPDDAGAGNAHMQAGGCLAARHPPAHVRRLDQGRRRGDAHVWGAGGHGLD